MGKLSGTFADMTLFWLESLKLFLPECQQRREEQSILSGSGLLDGM